MIDLTIAAIAVILLNEVIDHFQNAATKDFFRRMPLSSSYLHLMLFMYRGEAPRHLD